MDDAARKSFANEAIKELDEDASAAVEELYPASDGEQPIEVNEAARLG